MDLHIFFYKNGCKTEINFIESTDNNRKLYQTTDIEVMRWSIAFKDA